jgi:hypothetical protein
MKAPRIPSIFKLGERDQHRTFSYNPRTYSEQQERLAKRRKQIEKEIANNEGLGKNYESHLRDRISESWSRREMRRQKRNSSRRLLLILAVILMLLFLIYQKSDLLF